jgi:hypothetical protein
MNSQTFWLPKPAGITPIHNNQTISLGILDVITAKDRRKDSMVEENVEDDVLEVLDNISTTRDVLNSHESLAKYLEAHSHATHSIRAMLVRPVSCRGIANNA